MSFYCPYCNTENGAGPIWEGMEIRCPACLWKITLSFNNHMGPNKASNSYDGYAKEYREFCSLMGDDSAVRKAKATIERLLDCTIESFEGRYVLKRKGALIPFEVAHFTIQFDPVKQREFYNTWMDIYR